MMKRSVSDERMSEIRHCFNLIKKDKMEGSVLEFGMFEGWSMSEMILHCRNNQMYHRFYGFEGFQGMPETADRWNKGDGFSSYENTCSLLEQKLGTTYELTVIPGLFKDTLTVELQKTISKAVLVHVDCDLYSSTVDVLAFCFPFFQKGTFIVFDEYIEGHEKRAWDEFIRKQLFSFEVFIVSISDGVRVAREQGQYIFRIK